MFYESWGYIFTYYFENKKKSEYNGLKFLISFQVFYLYFHMIPARGVRGYSVRPWGDSLGQKQESCKTYDKCGTAVC